MLLTRLKRFLPSSRINSRYHCTVLSSFPKHNVLITDIEPDDDLGIMIMNRAGARFSHTIVTESVPPVVPLKMVYLKKRNRRQKDFLGELLLGDYSDKEYKFTPPEELTREEISVQQSYVADPNKFISETQEKLVKLFQDNDETNVVSIAPPRILFRIWQDPNIRHLLKKVNMWSYGSFNYRTIYSESDMTPEEKTAFFQFLNTGFKNAYTFETFFVMGSNNTVDKFNTPKFTEWIHKHRNNPDISSLIYLYNQWNKNIIGHMIRRVLKILEEEDENGESKKLGFTSTKYDPVRQLMHSVNQQIVQPDFELTFIRYSPEEINALKSMITELREMPQNKTVEGLLRASKITLSVLESPELQIVCADIGLALTMIDPEMMKRFERVHLSINEKDYLICSKPMPEDTHQYLIVPETDKGKMLSHYDDLLISLFEGDQETSSSSKL